MCEGGVSMSEGVRALQSAETSKQQFHLSFPYTEKLLKLYHKTDQLQHKLTQLCICEYASYSHTKMNKLLTKQVWFPGKYVIWPTCTSQNLKKGITICKNWPPNSFSKQIGCSM